MKNLSLIVAIIILPFIYCTLNIPEDPKLPKWDIEIERIPFLKADTLRVGDELDPEDFKRVGADSTLSIAIDNTTGFEIGEKLKIPAQNNHFSDRVGDFRITASQSVSKEVLFTELYPQLASFVGSSIIVPPAPLIPIEKTVEFDEFTSISIVSGKFKIQVENHLGFVLGNEVKLDLIDIGNGGVVIDSLKLDPIPDGQTDIDSVDLAGKTISNNLKTVIYGNLIGSEGNSVYISENSGFIVTVIPEEIVANRATAKLPEQTFSLSGDIDINSDTLVVKSAKVESGYLDVSINNQFEFPIEVNLTIPNLKDEYNQELTTQLTINPNSTQNSHIILDKTSLDLENKDLGFKAQMSIYPNSDDFYTLSSEDELRVDVYISEIQLEEVTADFDLRAEFPEINETIFENPPEELENINFHDAILTISFPNSDFDLDLDVTIRAIKDESVQELIINKTVLKDDTLTLDKNGINNDHSEPTIVDILNMIPEKLNIDGNVRVRGDNITFTKDDTIGVNYGIAFPLIFSLTSASYSDKDSLDLDKDARDNIRDYMLSASLEMTIENALPITGTVSLFVGADSTNISTEILSAGLPHPNLNNKGLVTQPGFSTLNIEIDKSKFEAIADAHYYKYKIVMDDVPLVQLTANNYIILSKVYISGKFLVDPEGMSEEDNNK